MDYDRARAEREFRQNPPNTAPGQGGMSDEEWGNLFPEGSSSVEPLSNPYANQSPNMQGGMVMDPNMQNGMNNPMQGGLNMNNQPMMVDTSTEDKILKVIGTTFKGIFAYVKNLCKSLTNNTKAEWHVLGVRIALVSVGMFAIGVLFCIIEVFLQSGNEPLDLVIGSLLSEIVGIFLCMFFDKGDIPSRDTQESIVPNEESFDILESIDLSEGNSDIDLDLSDDSFEFSDDELADDDWDSILDGMDISDNGTSIDANFNVNDALSNVPEITPGTQTRQYLFETFSRVLPLITPNFAKMVEISETDNIFFDFENMLRSAAIQTGVKDESIPELLSVQENPFIYRLNCSRPVGLKEQLIADEIASTFSKDEYNVPIRDGVYATVETSVGKYTINLFKGFSVNEEQKKKDFVKISLGDVYKNISSYVLNPSVAMPFVWGVNELGKVHYCDLYDNNSIIISGEPRGGKSWKGQSIIAQICMYNSPKDVEFYFFDPKNTASDYRYLSTALPHSRFFCGDPAKINMYIEKVIETKKAYADKVLSESGHINIKEYNAAHPMNKLPYIYIVIDEMMTIANYFENNNLKDEGAKFQGHLSRMVSQLAYMGIRFILFPHRIVNNIIAKNTYSLVSCRAVVNQLNEEEIKSSMGVSKKDFPYSLAQPGDMAVRAKEIKSGVVSYCHAEILTTSNSGNCKLFDFIGEIWKRLEPECSCISITGAIGGGITTPNSLKKVVNKEPSSVRDNTNDRSTYEYKGFGEGTAVSDLPNEFIDNEESDEDFWDDLLGEE